MKEIKRYRLWDCYESIFEGYDPDSSPFVWEYIYSKIYIEDNWGFWKIRMDLKENENISFKKKGIRQIACAGERCPDFGGETDFNFSEKKYNFFRKKINADDKELLEKLEICRKRHHALENFSLIPRTGNLQGVKGRGFDRLDCFICLLNDYYAQSRKNLEHEVFTGANSGVTNKEILKAYLDSFRDSEDTPIYNYCSVIYKMDKEWVDRMIKNGEKKDMERDHVREYLDLAIEYWNTKLKKYPDIYQNAYKEAHDKKFKDNIKENL